MDMTVSGQENRVRGEVRALVSAHNAEIDEANEHARRVSPDGLIRRAQAIGRARYDALLESASKELDVLEAAAEQERELLAVQRALDEARRQVARLRAAATEPDTVTPSASATPARHDSGKMKVPGSRRARLRAEARELGVSQNGKTDDQLEAAIATKRAESGA